jgi:hypothetical protein
MESTESQSFEATGDERKAKAVYVSPQLVRFGTLVELTKGEGSQVSDTFGRADLS